MVEQGIDPSSTEITWSSSSRVALDFLSIAN